MNVRSFNRLFRKFEGMPPSDFKRRDPQPREQDNI